MSGKYQVRSYYLNVNEGDCAVHLVVDFNTNNVAKAVIVDGGRLAGAKVIADFLDSYEMAWYKSFKFDSVVITHWDGDHCEGIMQWLYSEVAVKVEDFVVNGGLRSKGAQEMTAAILAAELKGQFQLPFLKYVNTWMPESRLYVPYWAPSDSGLGPDKGGPQFPDFAFRNGYLMAQIRQNNDRGTEIRVALRVLRCGKMKDDLLGVDLFNWDKPMHDDLPDSPADVSRQLAKDKKTMPVMYCVAADAWVLGGKSLVKDFYWGDEDSETEFSQINLKSLALRPKKTKSRGGQVGARAITGPTTPMNNASIVCMIIWPDCDGANVSHYLGGDCGEDREDKILRWATLPQPDGTRIPINIDSIKLSHHGSKYSTPLLMLFAWKPDAVVVSNSTNQGWNHPSWEVALLVCMYARWRREKQKVLMATNFPPYLCAVLTRNLTVEYLNKVGSVSSITDSSAKDLRDLLANFCKKGIFPTNPLESRTKQTNFEWCNQISGVLRAAWDVFSITVKHDYGNQYTNMLDSSEQKMRVLRLDHRAKYRVVARFFMGTDMERIGTAPPGTKKKVIKKKGNLLMTAGLPEKTVRGLGETKTKGSPFHENRRRRIPRPADLLGPRTFEMLLKDEGPKFDEGEQAASQGAAAAMDSFVFAEGDVAQLDVDSPKTRATHSVDSGFIIAASDAVVAPEDMAGVHRVAKGHLDWFLGDLAAGAMVLGKEPPAESVIPLPMTPLDKNDETAQWLLARMGDANDADCVVRVRAAVASDGLVKICGIELQTKLMHLLADPTQVGGNPFFTTPVVFSADNNGHALGAKGAAWPNVSATATDADIVGPAHIVCLSLGPTPSVADKAIGFADVLRMLGIAEPDPWLAYLSNLVGLQIDTEAGRKNALWYTPAEAHETTLRLCFKQADGQPNGMFAAAKKLLGDVAAVDLKAPDNVAVEPRLVVKRTWRQIDDTTVESEAQVTALLKVVVADSGGNNPLTLETALTFGDGYLEWVLDFENGGADFPQIVQAVGKIFNVDKAQTLAEDIKTYLPGSGQVSLRRVRLTKTDDGKWLEVVVQVTFADMIFLCALKVSFLDGGKTAISFEGSLFPESRPALMGPDFFWVPYAPWTETWTSLEIAAPVKKTLTDSGVVVEDDPVPPPASDVGDLRKAFNAFGSGSGHTLDTSPMCLELVGLQFAASADAVSFSARVMSDPPAGNKVPTLRLLGATLDLRYNVRDKKVDNCSLATCVAMRSPDPTLPAAVWYLDLAYENRAWTLSGGIQGLKGAFLHSLFDEQYNSEMSQVLAHMIFDLDLKYVYDAQAKASSFSATGAVRLGHLKLDARYTYPANGEWTFDASLNMGGDDDASNGNTPPGGGDKPDDGKPDSGGAGDNSLLSVLETICGEDLKAVLPDFVHGMAVQPVAGGDLTSLRVVKLTGAILVLLRLQLTATTSVAFYQYQKRRQTKDAKPPPTKRALVFSIAGLPSVKDIPLVGSLPQPFDEARFMWVGGGGADSKGWTRSEIGELNDAAANVAKGMYPQITFKEPPKDKKSQAGGLGAWEGEDNNKVMLGSGLHLCLVQAGQTMLDHVFFAPKPDKKPDPKPDPKLENSDSVFNKSGDGDAPAVEPTTPTSPLNKAIGPVTILGVGVAVNATQRTLKVVLDGTVKLGPIELTLLGFSLTFNLKGVTLTDFSKMEAPSFDLAGLAVGFQKDPLTIAGLFEHQETTESDKFLGGVIVGFKEYTFEGGGYYGTVKKPKKSDTRLLLRGRRQQQPRLRVVGSDDFSAFLAYVRVTGPIATMGYAELRGLVGGFGYNTSVRAPTIDNVQDFPFLAASPPGEPANALTAMLGGGWFADKEGQNWVAAGLTVLAFQTLTVNAVIVVEWGSGVKLGVFGLATAEMPRAVAKKFAVVQLGVVATIDVDAGIMKVDGQLTPASYVLDPSCHLTGGFALYSWFGAGSGQQGDWVFTIGGYHPSYTKPAPYPNPPRLAITWSYSSSINITGAAYFAVTPTACMGGGSLKVTLTLGSLYAYLDAFADFLINYRPFLYRASGGVTVGVHYTLDLWLVSIPIHVDLGAIITLQGPPLGGKVHVSFFVFGFDVAFGSQDAPANDAIPLKDFYKLALQTAPKTDAAGRTVHGEEEEEAQAADDGGDPTPPHILSCVSGLIPQNPTTQANTSAVAGPDKWLVRGAVFAFTVSCKFAVATAKITTMRYQDGQVVEDSSVTRTSTTAANIYAKPMHLGTPLGMSLLKVAVTPPQPHLLSEEDAAAEPVNPSWNVVELGYSKLPTALWGQYDSHVDPAAPGADTSSLLSGPPAGGGTTELLTSVTLHAPGSLRPTDHLAAFDVAKSAGEVGASRDDFPKPVDNTPDWLPALAAGPPPKDDERDAARRKRFADARDAWWAAGAADEKVARAASAMAEMDIGGWAWARASTREGMVRTPARMARDMEKWWIEPPLLARDAVAPPIC